MPYPPDDEKVTLKRLYQMKINWYYAGREFARKHESDVVDQTSLNELRYECNQGISACNEYLRGGRNPVLPKDQWERHYQNDRSMENSLIAKAKAAFGTDKAKVAVARFKDCYIRFLNNGSKDYERPWRPIIKEFDIGEMSLRSQQIPVNVHFPFGAEFVRYGETGLSSNTPRLSIDGRTDQENNRATNFWHTAMSLPLVDRTNLELFSGFRSGSLSGKIVGRDTPEYTDASVRELLSAAVLVEMHRRGEQLRWKNEQGVDNSVVWRRAAGVRIKTKPLSVTRQPTKWTVKQLAGLMTARNELRAAVDRGKTPVYVVSINLQTESLIANEQRMIVAQANTLAEYERVELDGGYVLSVLSFNCEVNNVGGSHVAKRNSMRLWSRFLGLARAYLEAGMPRTRPLEREYTGLAIAALLAKFDTTSEIELTNPANNYKTASRIAVLAHLCRFHVHFNCKSGKDRTGLMDVECKRLALSLLGSYQRSEGATVTVPRYTLQNDEEAALYQTLLSHAGNFEVQEYNTGGRGFKVAQMPKLSATDRALKERFGGEQGLQFVYGLKSYMDIDPLK